MLIVWPRIAVQWFLIDQALVLAGSSYCAIAMRRSDVLVWAPSFTVLRYLNSIIFLKTFWREIVRQRSLGAWFSVQRYGDLRSTSNA
jgi:hypothetical protein